MDRLKLLSLLIWFNSHGYVWCLDCQTNVALVEIMEKSNCNRQCEYPPQPKHCKFEFNVTWTNSMGSSCLDCPTTLKHCYKHNCIPIEGSVRPVIVTNDISPGPSIQVCYGDTIRVKVQNDLQDAGGLSIHWHGIHQVNTNWMDGVSMVTQCPIARASSFVYKFKADPPGTHWWHSHTGLHRGDGMYGSLIVRLPKESEFNGNNYDFDLSNHVLLINDWTSNLVLNNFAQSLDPGKPTSLHTLTIVANGKGRNVEFNDINEKTIYTPREVFEVENGMRIDFVLTASNTPSSYCIFLDGFPTNQCGSSGTAILKYKGASHEEPDCYRKPTGAAVFSTIHFDNTISIGSEEYYSLRDTHSLVPVDPDLYNVDEQYYITLNSLVSAIRKENGQLIQISGMVLQMDNVEFKFPPHPLVNQDISNIDICHVNQEKYYQSCNASSCYCTNLMKIELGKVVEFVVINNVNIVPHPMHLHGHSFRVLGQQNLNDTLDRENIIELDKRGKLQRINIEETVVKDTVNVPQYGYTIIRWKAQNPGFWFFHCHVDYHSESGMTMIIQVGDQDEMPQPHADFPTCGPWSPD
ncbi:laccase-1-like isoform X2 [Anneissia japonica]|uniref:laccase-1-like isoform X2 n=1 Tax=Anneissia japonica TaxID=1529436 RepID=UPI0014254CD1|nr:laccase-1-like isoform X2 [Anneissia japonica]